MLVNSRDVLNWNIFCGVFRRIWTNRAQHILPHPPHLATKIKICHSKVSPNSHCSRNGNADHGATDYHILLLQEHVGLQTLFMWHFNNGRCHIVQSTVFWWLRFHTDTSQHSQPQQTAAATHQPAHSGCSFTQAQCSAENVKQMNAIPKICQFHSRKCSTSPTQYRQVIISDIRSGICQTDEFSCVHAVQFWVPSAFCSACNNLPKHSHIYPPRLTE